MPVSPTPLLLLLVLLLHSGAALKCFDCLSTSLPSCLDAENSKEFDVTECPQDEKFCSVLKMRDTQGKLIVGRQCSASRDEGATLLELMAPLLSDKVELEAFNACDTDECNGKRRSAETKGSTATTLSPLASTCAAFVLSMGMAALLH